MKRYKFEIWDCTTNTSVERNVAMADADGLWKYIGDISSRTSMTDGFIKVTDETGDIVLLIGLSSASYLCTAGFLADAPS